MCKKSGWWGKVPHGALPLASVLMASGGSGQATLGCDWSIEVTWPEHWPLIGHKAVTHQHGNTVMMTLSLSWYLSTNTWYPALQELLNKQSTAKNVRNKIRISSTSLIYYDVKNGSLWGLNNVEFCHDTSPQIKYMIPTITRTLMQFTQYSQQFVTDVITV